MSRTVEVQMGEEEAEFWEAYGQSIGREPAEALRFTSLFELSRKAPELAAREPRSEEEERELDFAQWARHIIESQWGEQRKRVFPAGR